MSTQTDEIDLLELLAKITLAIKSNLKSLVTAFIVGSILGLVYYQFAPKIFEAKMILLSDILKQSQTEKITESLENLIKESNTKVLAERLAITEKQASSISKIEIESVKKTQVIDEKDGNAIFIVTIKTKDNAIFPILQDGIINHLRGNEFVKIRVRQRQDFYLAMIEKVGQEIKSLDSLKNRLFKGQTVYAKSAEMMLIDPTSIYSKIIELNKEQINYKNALELVNSIQLVEGFTVYNKPVSPKLSTSLVAGASIGIFFVLALLGVKSLRKIVQLSEEKLGKS